ncbi:MAG TPA: alkaline phosphatase family protein [Myxococcales bacterium]|nr:alkaline phosphatase family protein [Myxococcales bacterium]
MRHPLAPCLALLAACGQAAHPPQYVIQFDIDDHGLLGLWAANAPNLKGLIARGTFAYSRVDVPTHSNHNNMTELTGQYPDGDDVPANSYLDRANDFQQWLNFGGGFALGNYADYPQNPLVTRSDSVYLAAERLGIAPAYFGQLPPFEAGASNVHFTANGVTIAGYTVSTDIADALLEGSLGYPPSLVASYQIDGPPDAGETISHFTIRDAASFIASTGPSNPMPRYLFVWDFLALDGDPTSSYGADGPQLEAVIEDYDDALGDVLDALEQKGLAAQTNIVFTLDHGKVDSYQQVCLGTHGTDSTGPADGQLGALVTAQGASVGVSPNQYEMINEDGDALIWAVTPDAGTAAGAAEQEAVTHGLLQLIQSGAIVGLDTSRTISFDGYLGTRRMHDFHNEGPYQADIIVFPQTDGGATWTLGQVDPTNAVPGPFQQHTQYPFGRHGGFSADELYVPLILSGPAFKEGVMIPQPVNHVDVAPTAMRALGVELTDAEGAPILAAFQGQPGETIPQPADMTKSRDTVLQNGGYEGPAVPSAARSAVIIDVAGLYYDEAFTDQDPDLRQAAQPFLDLAAQGTLFDHFYDRYRDWPVNEYEMLVGGYPVQLPFVPFAEDDPAQSAPPGFGLLAIPAPSNFIADQAGFAAWHSSSPTSFGQPSLFDAAQADGFRVALVGQPDFHGLHIDTSQLDLDETADPASAAGIVGAFLADHPRSVVVVPLGSDRTADRHSPQAVAELAALASEVQAIVRASWGSLILVTSRGATDLGDSGPADYYGYGSSRHVPLLALGPNVPGGVITSQPGDMADIPATVLVGLGVAARTDIADGTWAAGTAVNGIARPAPEDALGGHALVRAFGL